MHHQASINTNYEEEVEQKFMVERNLNLQRHQDYYSKALLSLQSFVDRLQELPYRKGSLILFMDLYGIFTCRCGIELPRGFEATFDKMINQACRDGHLPFNRMTFGHDKLPLLEGLDIRLLPALMGMEC